MITYLVNFTLCSALLLIAYHLLLVNKTTYTFNRAYLLLSLVFSLTIPFITVKQSAVPLVPITQVQEQLQLIPDANVPKDVQPNLAAVINPVVEHNPINYIFYGLIAIYGLISLLLLYRFIRNLNSIISSISLSERIEYKGARLVLIDERQTPHTFLNFIFLNRKDYHNRKIEADILLHELAHARQRHSADVIFIELVQAIYWFNPFIILYRRAIQLNHEFIADEAVLNNNPNITNYQHLLLSKLGYVKSLDITSQFNYSITKKRLIMMTKTTSTIAALFARLAIIPVMAIAFVLFCTRTEAQQEPAASKPSPKTNVVDKQQSVTKTPKRKLPIFLSRDYPHTKAGVSEEQIQVYNAIAAKYEDPKTLMRHPQKISKADRDSMEAIFKQMSFDQQCDQIIGFTYNGPPIAAKQPTERELNLWKNPKMYGVWIDDKKVANSELDNYKATDFDLAMVSRLMKTAINYKNYKYQVNLLTVAAYKKYREDAIANRYHSGMYFSMINKPAK